MLEMGMDRLTYDTRIPRACTATRLTLYNVGTPHLHHTLTPLVRHGFLTPELDLLPLVKRTQLERIIFGTPWVSPPIFDTVSHLGVMSKLLYLILSV